MPSWEIEDKYNNIVCGVDEAGRGPWIGPVVAGAVIFLNRNVNQELINSLNDSKKLSAKKREKLYSILWQEEKLGNVVCSIGLASAQEIDELNILQATFLAMQRAVDGLKIKPQMALIDGNRVPQHFSCQCSCWIGGDAKSYSISAASILAKVYRDNLMKDLAVQYPQYNFEKNAGYGTKEHVEALNKFGVTPEHRKSYKPIKMLLEKAV